jgi:hypothetical protein
MKKLSKILKKMGKNLKVKLSLFTVMFSPLEKCLQKTVFCQRGKALICNK